MTLRLAAKRLGRKSFTGTDRVGAGRVRGMGGRGVVHRMLAVAATVAALSGAGPARACTTFCFDAGGALVFGRNYDWGVGDGLVIVNKRGVVKKAYTTDHPARWTSAYGSVTFNQYGREFPTGGINEKGLVVELMWLDATEYPAPDERASVPTLQWIQYQLDRCATVDDVVASDRDVRITGTRVKLHFLVADAGGETAAIEFLGGKMVAHRDRTMPYRVLTNDTYDASVEYARTTDAASDTSPSSLDRFARAAAAVSRSPAPENTVDAAFDLLGRVAQVSTQWSVVYDIKARRVYFRTRLARDIRSIDLAKLDFSCATPVEIIDVNGSGAGDVTGALVAYTRAANQAVVRAAYAKTEFLSTVPVPLQDAIARYPEQMRCAR